MSRTFFFVQSFFHIHFCRDIRQSVSLSFRQMVLTRLAGTTRPSTLATDASCRTSRFKMHFSNSALASSYFSNSSAPLVQLCED